jgi:hypothetical protein
MKTTVKEITPQWAKKILETRNPRNRRLSERFVAKLARDIKAGAFAVTHQGIAFDANGDLLDGQHRLAAIALADMPVKMLVTNGVPTTFKLNGGTINAFELVDGGNPRRVGAMLQMAGYASGNRVAAAVKAVILACARCTNNIGVSTAQTHKALMYFGKSVEVCVAIGASGKIIKPQSWIIGPVALYHATRPIEAEQFLRAVCDVTGETGTATRALAAYCRGHSTQGGQQQIGYFKVAASALWHNNQKNKISKLFPSEAASEWLVNLNKPLSDKLSSIINP